MVLSSVASDCRIDEEMDRSPLAKALSDEDLHGKWKTAIAGAKTFSWDQLVCEKHCAKGAITRSRERRRRNGENREISKKRGILSPNAVPSILDATTQKPRTEASRFRNQLRSIATENDCQSRLLASLDMEQSNEKGWFLPLSEVEPPAAFFRDCVPLLESLYSTVSEESTSIFSPDEQKWLLSVDLNEESIKVVEPLEREGESATARYKKEEARAKNDDFFALLSSAASNIDEKRMHKFQLKEEAAAAENSELFAFLPSARSNIDEKRMNVIKSKIEEIAVKNDEIFMTVPSTPSNADEKRINAVVPKKKAAASKSRDLFTSLTSTASSIVKKHFNAVLAAEEAAAAGKSEIFPSLKLIPSNFNEFSPSEGACTAESGQLFPSLPLTSSEAAATPESGNLAISFPSTPSNIDRKYAKAVLPLEEATPGKRSRILPSTIDNRLIDAVLPTEEATAIKRSRVLRSTIDNKLANAVLPLEEATPAKRSRVLRSTFDNKPKGAVLPIEEATPAKRSRILRSTIDNKPIDALLPTEEATPAKWSKVLRLTIDNKPTNAILPIEEATPAKRPNILRSNIKKRYNAILRTGQAAAATEKGGLFPSLPLIPTEINENSSIKGPAKPEPANQLRSPLQNPLTSKEIFIDLTSPIKQPAAVKNVDRDSLRLWTPWKIDEKCAKAAAPSEAAASVSKTDNPFPPLHSFPSDFEEKLFNEILPSEGAGVAGNGDLLSSLPSIPWNLDEKLLNEILCSEGLVSIENDNPGASPPSVPWNIDENFLNELLPPAEAFTATRNDPLPPLPATPWRPDELRSNSKPPIESSVYTENLDVAEKSVDIPLPMGGSAILKITSALSRQSSAHPKNQEKPVEEAAVAAAPQGAGVEIENPSLTYKHTATVFPPPERVSGIEIQTADARGASIKMPSSDDVEVRIITPQGAQVLVVPKPWNFVVNYTNNERQWQFFQISLNESSRNTPVIHRSVSVDKDDVIRYYVHGLMVQRCYHRLPRILTDLKEISSILKRFENVHVCVGLGGGTVASLAMFEATCRDHLNLYRAKNCWLLLGKRGQCVACLKLKRLDTNRKRKSAV